MAQKIQTLPGFRDFYPEDCAVRNYVFDHWRAVARRYGFHEYEGPILEPTDLYRKKSGDEIVGQLFHFTDKGEREVAMRPELTPTLARMAGARQRDYKKPMKWFGIGRFFRYEKQQKGRLREFYQLNCDILGEASMAADGELIAMAVDLMRGLGFSSDDFFIRLSDRNVWLGFLETQGIDTANAPDFLQIIDKLAREKPDITDQKLTALGTSRIAVEAFIAEAASGAPHFRPLLEDLAARGMADFVKVDLGIVRGLAYYTGVVFEIFDRGAKNRAVAGGGRYDNLCALVSDGASDLPACGFAMGDVVIADFINETATPKKLLLEHLATAGAADVFVIVADEEKRPDALATVQRLRQEGHRVEYALTPAKIGKQFQAAEAMKARAAVIIGGEYPAVKVKDLAHRVECEVDAAAMLAKVREIVTSDPGEGPLLA
jgi:histidyl-tRNA synthetase